VKVALDTSVLVAGMVAAHPAHERSVAWLQRVRRGEVELVVASHCLAETFAVLTSLPTRPRLAPAAARRLIQDNVVRSATLVPLDAEDYVETIEGLSLAGIAGGATYDALIARAAQIGGAEVVVTLNPAHFRRVWPAGADRVVEP
jgi:predicted nucleic acid-binding protein